MPSLLSVKTNKDGSAKFLCLDVRKDTMPECFDCACNYYADRTNIEERKQIEKCRMNRN